MVKKKRQNDPQNDNSSTESCDENVTSPTSCGTGCPHSKKSIDLPRLRKIFKSAELLKVCSECQKLTNGSGLQPDDEDFSYDDTLWLCLKCGTQLCGRARNEHALKHFQTPRSDLHTLVLNTTNFDIWCYECRKEVESGNRKNIQECIEFVKKLTQKSLTLQSEPIALPPPPPSDVLEESIKDKILVGFQSMQPLLGDTAAPIFNPPKPPAMPCPGIARRTTSSEMPPASRPAVTTQKQFDIVDSLPRVRGLTNLGNTCFFNAVLQCLAQTPYLLDVLKEMSEAGEEFVLPGGVCEFGNGEKLELPPIKGVLSSWGSLTQTLAETLQELQNGGGVFTPSELLGKLTAKCSQFAGGDQHDSHELLRQLLETVRSEDLQRYQKFILQDVGFRNSKNLDLNSVPDEIKKKCRMYGSQAYDRILRPEQVFRGFLVSTLMCQECMHTSSRHESFLDVSVPVSVEKPQPPHRRKNSPDCSPISASGPSLSKHQVKKEKEKERKAKRAAKHKKKKQPLQNGEGGEGAAGTSADADDDGGENSGSSIESDADVEDNLEETASAGFIGPLNFDTNGNTSTINSPDGEKRGDSPEMRNKDDENDSGISASPTANSNVVLEVGISERGANLVRSLSTSEKLTNGYLSKSISESLERLDLSGLPEDAAEKRKKQQRVRTQSYSDWSTTVAPRYQCKDGECSVQSCLNNFTAVELMTGNNKVGCEACTKRINGEDEKAKTVNTNATKQYLVSSPPAVLILHLKRFQVEFRGLFKKMTRHVSFPTILDIAPFCGSKVKNLPNIDRKQKKLMYSLYGVVEHSGGMYGGHYVAYVKVRPKLLPSDKRWKFLPQGSKAELDQEDEQKVKLEELLAREKAREMRLSVSANDSDDFSNSSSSDLDDLNEEDGAVGGQHQHDPEVIEPPPGKWYYVSDSRVQEVSEDKVLSSQAYLLFYERIY